MSNTENNYRDADARITAANNALNAWIKNGAALNGTGKATIVSTGLVQLGAAGEILSKVISEHKGEIIDPTYRRLREIAAMRELFCEIIAQGA